MQQQPLCTCRTSAAVIATERASVARSRCARDVGVSSTPTLSSTRRMMAGRGNGCPKADATSRSSAAVNALFPKRYCMPGNTLSLQKFEAADPSDTRSTNWAMFSRNSDSLLLLRQSFRMSERSKFLSVRLTISPRRRRDVSPV